MKICKICNTSIKKYLKAHLRQTDQITDREYFDLYFKNHINGLLNL